MFLSILRPRERREDAVRHIFIRLRPRERSVAIQKKQHVFVFELKDWIAARLTAARNDGEESALPIARTATCSVRMQSAVYLSACVLASGVGIQSDIYLLACVIASAAWRSRNLNGLDPNKDLANLGSCFRLVLILPDAIPL